MKKTAQFAMLCAVVGMLTAVGARAASNSLVRFHFTHGSTVVGDVVVELFDDDKPVTVQNFLRYVTNGSYDNLILNRCVTNFVIQSGAARSINPLSQGAFTGFFSTISGGNITNEFGVGPVYSNVFGTLAMARSSNLTNAAEYVTNSANSSWFFNIADNSSSLDHAGGGFTVFGRTISGSNVLNYFNRLRPSLGITDLRVYLGDAFGGPFSQLPVAYNPTSGRYPRFSEMYHVQVTPVSGLTDPKRPTINIVSPANGFRLSNELVTVTGTASDNAGVNMVWYSLNDGEQTNAIGSTNWSASLQLKAGTNFFYAQSVDSAGRRSPFVSRMLFWSIPQAIGVHHFGNGTVTGPTNGQVLELQRYYTLNAIPAPRHTFHSWTGQVAGEAFTWLFPKLTLIMQSNLTATALFVTNPFPPLKGAYVGTFFNVTNFLNQPELRETLGMVSFNVTDQGKFSGRIKQGIGSYPFSGSFSTRGSAKANVARPGLIPLEIQLTLDVTNRSIEVPLLITDNHNWGSYGKAIRAAAGTSARPSSYAGQYTVALPGGINNPTNPPGQGPGSVKIGASGVLNFAGNLPDGTPVTQGTPITTNGLWPLFLPLYGGKGVVHSWAQFDTNQPNDDVRGPYTWLKFSNVSSPIYPAGFIITNILTGSLYRIPLGTTNRVLQLTNAQFAFTDGNLPAAVTNQVMLLTNYLISDPSDFTFKATFTKANGFFTGSFLPPDASKAIDFKGAIYQKRNIGAGYFRGTNQTGSVFLGP